MIHIRQQGSVATIALERPEARNALPIAGWDALAEALHNVGDARVVILKSEVRGIFSAGADVREFERLQDEPDLRVRFREAMRGAIEGVAALPVPVVAAIDGGCFGAAVALALAADFRIAGDGAEFATTPARLGVGYPEEDVARLVAQVGKGMASAMLFTGDRVRADEAERIGLAELRAPSAEEAAAALAATIAANAPGAVRLLKRALGGERGLAADFDGAFGGIELAEGLRAFRERRKPSYL